MIRINLMTGCLIILISFSLTNFNQIRGTPQQGDVMYFKMFTDPTVGAFSLLVPLDWSVQGGIDSGNLACVPALQPSFYYNIVDPTGTMWISNSAPRPPQYSFTLGYLPEGSWYPYEGCYFQLHYMTADEYAEQVLLPALSQQYGNVELEHIPNPMLENALRNPIFGWSQVSAEIARFTFDIDGVPYTELVNIVTRSIEEFQSQMWFADTNSITAPQDRVGDLFGVYKLVLSSHDINEDWLVQVTHGQISAAQAYLQGSREITDAFFGGLASTVPDLGIYGQATLGITEVIDPGTGQTYTVPHDFQYWFKNPEGIIAGSNTAIDDPSFTPLQPIN